MMKLIVGLGNPGEKYESTRHNLGFMVVEQFVKDLQPVKKTFWEDSKKFKSDILEVEWQPRRGNSVKILVVKPKTYMNNSGLAISLISQYLNILPSDVWIVHDELDLPLGFIKIRLGGSGAGHRGVESIIQSIGSEKFWRFRLGIGFKKNHGEVGGHVIKHVDDYVLSPFSREQAGKIRELIHRCSKALQMALEEGLEVAMNRYNTK